MNAAAGSNTTKARSGVFISYARSDGEGFATRLRALLAAEGFALWQDRTGMEGGHDWWLQITEALDRVEFMVLVMTPNALRSPVVRKEWRYARQQGVCVYPVKGAPDLDYASLPRWMRDAHFYDVGSLEGRARGPEWAKLLNDLRTSCRSRRVPFMAEDLPEDFVERPGEFEQLIPLLLDQQREEPVAITAALRGAGGYGKTTLARALCHDERVQDAFDDGVLWVTLGESPGDLTGRVEDLIYTLTEERPGFAGLDAATARLVELLADRDILLVIDDVWNGEHLRPFLQGGPRCARLITTRNADTLPSKTQTVNVDSMRREEAVELLGSGLADAGRADLGRLAGRLGEWPLLLKLVNGTLRERVNRAGQDLPAAVAYVNKALDKRGLTFFDARNPAAREQAVARTLGVSLEQLSDAEQARYQELAVFPEDADVPLSTLEKFWGATGGLDEFDTEALCERLARLSLLLRFDLATRQIRLHDVIRAFLIQQQGGGLHTLHRQLLDAHRPAPAPTPWADMPPGEPYLWDQLAYHLTEAGLGAELVAAVKDLRYLAAKTFLRKSLPVEQDLLAAEAHAPEDAALRLLRRTFVQSGHILNRCETPNDLRVTLFSRLHADGELSELMRNFIGALPSPRFSPLHPLPDLSHPALIRTLAAHSGTVNDCAISQDGSVIVSASSDKTLKVWETKSGKELRSLEGHAGEVNACAISGDGSWIVSASRDNLLKVWDAETGAERLTLKGHENNVTDCAISRDGAWIISASWDQTLKLWDAATGAELHTFAGHESWVNSCAISSDKSFVVSGSWDRTLRLWDVETGKERFTVPAFDVVNECAIGPDDSFVVSALWHSMLQVWDAETGDSLRRMAGHTSVVADCAVSPDGSSVASASWDRTIRVWDVPTASERRALHHHTESVNAVAFSADSTLLISASNDWTLGVWDLKSTAELRAPVGHTAWVNRCAVSPDDALVVTASWDETLKVWEAATGDDLRTMRGHDDVVSDCSVSPDGSSVVSASFDGTLKVWELETGREIRTLSGHRETVSSCAFSPDGTFVVSASWDRTLKIWDVEGGDELRTLEGHTDNVTGCAISPDGSFIVSASEDGTLKVWDAQTGAERYELKGHDKNVNNCVVSPDGSFIVSASRDGTLKVWDAQTGEERLTLSGHKGAVSGCDVSSDNSFIISAAWDATLRLWDMEDGMCLSALYVDKSLIDCKLFKDNRRVMAVGHGGIYFLEISR